MHHRRLAAVAVLARRHPTLLVAPIRVRYTLYSLLRKRSDLPIYLAYPTETQYLRYSTSSQLSFRSLWCPASVQAAWYMTIVLSS